MERLGDIFLILFICLTSSICNSQNQRIADSLASEFQELQKGDSIYFAVLSKLCYNESDPVAKLKYSKELFISAKELSNPRFEMNGSIFIGLAHMRLSNYELALESFFHSLEIASRHQYTLQAGQTQSSIADVYDITGNFANAKIYYDLAIESLVKANDSVAIATAYLNYGDALFNNNELESASSNFENSLEYFEELNSQEGVAFNLGNLGMVYAKQGKHDQAESNMNKAIETFEEMENYYPISIFLTYIADIYIEKNSKSKALAYASRSLELANTYDLKNEISNAHFKLHEIHNHFGAPDKALHHYQAHIAMRDSINNIKTVEALANQRTEFEVSQKQTELDLSEQKSRTNSIIAMGTGAVAGLFSLVALLLYRNNRFAKKTNKIIAEQKERSDNLLLNILPKETAEELKENGKVKAKRFESTSVLFADFVGFTKFSKNKEPEIVVETIDRYFRAFDDIVVELGLEKIKTLGDGYMCAGGLPVESEDHATRLIQAAIQMKAYVIQKYEDQSSDDSFGIRIGIHSGPVVSGVVGSKKFAYDIWGDTVNTAARLESHSEPGKINISEETYDMVKDNFACVPRTPRDVKGKGMMKMYFVEEALV